MNRDELLQKLAQFYQQQHDTYKIKRIGIFGSVARNQATAASDVDVVVDLIDPDLFIMAGIKLDLEDMLHCPVDIVRYRQNMNPFLKNRIDSEAIYVR
jgi:uncharacterized protein